MLKVFAYGTDYFVDTYAKGLIQDCKKFDYELTLEKVSEGSFSVINHVIHQKMLQVVKEAGNQDRILFLDPECRIIKPIPQHWIEDTRPIVCYKIQHGKHDIDRYTYGHTIQNSIQMQPIFLSQKDISWVQWWYDVSLAASDPENKQYSPHELFLELALTYNKIDLHKQFCVYNRAYTKNKHHVVKGSYTTDDTIITHPDVHGMLDPNTKHAIDQRKSSRVLEERTLHNHFQDYELVKIIDELMFKEKDQDWPSVCINRDGWYESHAWSFNPKQGLVKHRDFPTIKYHHSIIRKQTAGLKTPVTKLYAEETE